jgi:hypothetical protein
MSEQVRPILTKRGSESADTGQSGGAVRITGVGTQNSPATKIWFGKASNEPGFRSLPHHHAKQRQASTCCRAARASITATIISNSSR